MCALSSQPIARNFILVVSWLVIMVTAQACVSVRTIPSIARAGDTVSMMVAGSEDARKDTVSATLISEVNGHQEWDLQAMGLIRSVFNLRADGRAAGLHYLPYGRTFFSWVGGHEPLQTVMVVDLPTDVPVGPAQLSVDVNVFDDTSGIDLPATIQLEIIDGTGTIDGMGVSDDFAWQDRLNGGIATAANLSDLEPAPYAKVSFGSGNQKIGAVSLVIDFDENVVVPDDLNVYVPQAVVRGGPQNLTFRDEQRMVYWQHDGQQLSVDIVAPQGIHAKYLMAYVVHAPGVVGDPAFTLVSAALYDTDGNPITISGQPSVTYAP